MMRWLLVGIVLFGIAGLAAPSHACCDWTARDTAFWQQMSDSPRKFSFDLDARPSPYRILVNDRELRVGPEGADWHEIYHAIGAGGPAANHRRGDQGPGVPSRKAGNSRK